MVFKSVGRKWIVITVIGVVLLVVLVSWIGSRQLAYRHEASLREGISALKSGEYKIAIRKIEPYAEAGNALAQSVMGDIYAFGLGVPYDEIKAAFWFRRFDCSKGSPGKGEYGVAYQYWTGTPFPKDPSRAVKWLRRAAEAGHKEAQRLLADEAKLAEKGLKVDTATLEYWRGQVAQYP